MIRMGTRRIDRTRTRPAKRLALGRFLARTIKRSLSAGSTTEEK